VRTDPPAKVDRNAVSARGGKVLTEQERITLANSITSISKDVCPPSTFTVRRQMKVDGKPMQVDIIPTSTAAHILRRDPICLGQQIKELYVDKNGAKLRELLAHDDSMQVDGNSNDGSSDSG